MTPEETKAFMERAVGALERIAVATETIAGSVGPRDYRDGKGSYTADLTDVLESVAESLDRIWKDMT